MGFAMARESEVGGGGGEGGGGGGGGGSCVGGLMAEWG